MYCLSSILFLLARISSAHLLPLKSFNFINIGTRELPSVPVTMLESIPFDRQLNIVSKASGKYFSA